MSHHHKLVQSWSAQNGVEREADLRNIEEDALRAEVLCHPECDQREMQPRGVTETGPTPKNGRDSCSFPIGICSFLKAIRLMRLRAAPRRLRRGTA
jgi:hypothetical protein